MSKWTKTQLVIPTDNGPMPVTAWVCGLVAVRERGEIDCIDAGNDEWVTFFVPTGFAISTAPTRKEAKAIAKDFHPVALRVNRELIQAAKKYETDEWRNRENAA